MPFLTRHGVKIHWESQGSGTPLLLVMGHRFSSAMWWPVLDALAAKHQVITFDNRGTGLSDAPRVIALDDLTDDAVAVLDAAGIAAAHVFGVSMGGGVAIELGIRYPQRVTSLVLGCIGPKLEVTGRPAKARALYHLPQGLLARLSGKALYGDDCPADMKARDQAVLAKDKVDKHGVIAQSVAVAGYSTTLEKIASITAPTLVLHGTKDPVVPYAGGVLLAQTVPGARLVSYEGARHNFIVDNADAVGSEVLRFVAGVDAQVVAG